MEKDAVHKGQKYKLIKWTRFAMRRSVQQPVINITSAEIKGIFVYYIQQLDTIKMYTFLYLRISTQQIISQSYNSYM